MLFLSLGLIIVLGLSLSRLFQKIHIPNILGMIVTGIILGPYALNLLSGNLLDISSELCEIALVIILLRAGLTLEIDDLKEVGKPALFMCFIPAIFEIIAATIFAPIFLGIPRLDAAILGCILAPVSAAIVVPYMLDILNKGYGKSKKIPQLIIAGTSIDDVLIIVIFTSLLAIKQGGSFNVFDLAKVPLSIILGVVLGIICGKILMFIYDKFEMRATVKLLALIATALLVVALENLLPQIPMSGMLSVIVLGITILSKKPKMSKEFDEGLNKIWIIAQLVLFVMVGASVNIVSAASILGTAILLLLSTTVFRTIGVFFSLSKTNLNTKEKFFSSLAYFPKATVQAAMGAVPLSIGMKTGNLILSVAVISILLFAPLGAILIDKLYSKLLTKDI